MPSDAAFFHFFSFLIFFILDTPGVARTRSALPKTAQSRTPLSASANRRNILHFFFKKKCSKDCAMAHIYHDASVKIQQINNNHKKKLKVFLPAQWPTPLSASVPTHYVPLPERVRERVRGRALEFARDLSL